MQRSAIALLLPLAVACGSRTQPLMADSTDSQLDAGLVADVSSVTDSGGPPACPTNIITHDFDGMCAPGSVCDGYAFCMQGHQQGQQLPACNVEALQCAGKGTSTCARIFAVQKLPSGCTACADNAMGQAVVTCCQ